MSNMTDEYSVYSTRSTAIAELSALFGPSGHEDAVIREILTRLTLIGLKPQIDTLGNVTVPIVHAQSGYPCFVICAHMDEIGFIVRAIDNAGWLSLSRVGGVNDRVLAGQVIQVRSDAGELIQGHIGLRGAHLSSAEELQRVIPVESAYVDLLAADAHEVRGRGIHVGSPATFLGPFCHNGNVIRGKAFDDRIGLAIALEIARRAHQAEPRAGLTFIATVQEEFSQRAGIPAIQRAGGDVLVCVDIAPADDGPDGNRSGPALGDGAIIHRYSRGRTGGGLIPNPRLADYVVSTARNAQLAYHESALIGGLTDGSYMQYAGDGFPVVDLAFPVRNSHTAVEVANLDDVQALTELLWHMIADAPRTMSFARG